MNLKFNNLEKRILDISYKNNLSHLSSSLGSVNIIDEIYSIKKNDEPFILSNGHSGLALYVVLEKYFGTDAEYLFHKHGVHPNRDLDDKIYFSTGSLGCGITAACGMALADKNRNVYCLISDGESFEGSVYESLNLIHKYKIKNLKTYCNVNGYSALCDLDKLEISERLKNLMPEMQIVFTDYIYKKFKFLNGLSGHYNTLTEKDIDAQNIF
jgi:transketolase